MIVVWLRRHVPKRTTFRGRRVLKARGEGRQTTGAAEGRPPSKTPSALNVARRRVPAAVPVDRDAAAAGRVQVADQVVTMAVGGAGGKS